MAWVNLSFGKYEGESIARVVFKDPDWFFWAYESKAFKSGQEKEQAETIASKAKRIKIPDGAGYDMVEYYIDPVVNKLSDCRPISSTKPHHQGSSRTFRKKFFDLSAARQVYQYDKKGRAIVIRAIKYHVFGESKTKLTKRKCEAFFENDNNFG